LGRREKKMKWKNRKRYNKSEDDKWVPFSVRTLKFQDISREAGWMYQALL
jgi:hypothetical protein